MNIRSYTDLYIIKKIGIVNTERRPKTKCPSKLTRAINRLNPSLKKLWADVIKCEAEVQEGMKTFIELYNNFKAAHEEKVMKPIR